MTTPQPQLGREVAGILKIKVNANVIFTVNNDSQDRLING